MDMLKELIDFLHWIHFSGKLNQKDFFSLGVLITWLCILQCEIDLQKFYIIVFIVDRLPALKLFVSRLF